MPLSAGIEKEIICKDPWFDTMGSHARQPGPHEQGNQEHGKRASLWDGASVLVRCTDALPNLVVDNQLLLEGFVSRKDITGHSSCSGQCDDQWSK